MPTVGGSSGQSGYDFSQIGTPHSKFFGHKLRVDENKVVHIDTWVGQLCRSLIGTKYANASEAKSILEQLSKEKTGSTDAVKAVQTAAVKVLVLTGTEEDKKAIKGSMFEVKKYDKEFKNREKKLLLELLKNPEIERLDKQLCRLLRIPFTPTVPTFCHTERLKALKDYGVDFQTGKLNSDTYAAALAKEIIGDSKNVYGEQMETDGLENEIKRRLDEIKSVEDITSNSVTFQSIRTNNENIQNVENLHVRCNKLKNERVITKYSGSQIGEALNRDFKLQNQRVQAKFMIDLLKQSNDQDKDDQDKEIAAKLFKDMHPPERSEFFKHCNPAQVTQYPEKIQKAYREFKA